MKKVLQFIAIIFVAKSSFAQNNKNTTSSYIQIQSGLGKFQSMELEQFGVAHKRGDFNEFDTDFDLNVHVNGKSKISNSNSIGITFGQLWKNEKQKIQYGLGMNLTYVSSNIHCVLKNKNNEVVSNINGANGHEVIDFVNEHYGAGHHVFENNFNLRSYTTNIEASIQKEIAEGTSIYTTIGCGVSFLDLKNATSMQTSPASTPPGFETTDDLDGGAVNHFNGGNHAGDLTFNTTAKIGLSHDLKNNLVLLLEGQSQFIGKGDFIFGSTQYSDHAPTNHWRMTKAANNCYTMTLGLRFNFN